MNEMPPRVLVVDDDTRLRELLGRYLREQGFEATTVANAMEMDDERRLHRFDLVVLDLMLPGEDGLSVCRRLRGAEDDVPIVMLTARGDDVDRIVGLEMGADDYLAKPFNPRELVARIKAVLRRRPGAGKSVAAPVAAPVEERIAFGPFRLNLGLRRLTRDGQPLVITSGEFAILRVLVEHPRQTLSRDRLMELARGREHGAYDRSIDVQISRLRRLLEDDPAKPRYLQTVWGVGYVFIPDA